MAIEAKLFPQMALLEQPIKNSGASTLNFTIVAIDADYSAAKTFKGLIETAYPDGILKRQIIVNIEIFGAQGRHRPDALIVLAHTREDLKAIAEWANTKRIVSFSYDPYDLREGFVASIHLGKTAKPYLNERVIRQYGFIFDQYLLRLSRFFND